MPPRPSPGGVPGLVLGAALAAVAGFVDAVGYLQFGGLFASFMSGNTTRLGADLAGPDWSGAVPAAVLVGLFVAGACAGVLARAAAGPRLCLPVVLALDAGLLAVAAAILSADRGGGPGSPAAALAPLAFAMGLQNAARQRVGAVQVGATFVTGALVGLGQSLAEAALGRRGAAAAALTHAAGWASLLLGAAAGAALLLRAGPAAAVAVPLVALSLLAPLTLALAGRPDADGP